MNRRRFLAGCGGLCGLAPSAFGDDPAAPRSINRLIDQLGSKPLKEQEAGSKRLEQLGDKALPARRKAANDHPAAEVRQRARRLVTALDPAKTTAECLDLYTATLFHRRLAVLTDRAFLAVSYGGHSVGPGCQPEQSWWTRHMMMCRSGM